MQLKIQRSQRQSGIVSKAVVFCVDARIFLTAEEQANVTRYKLGGQIIYSSEAAKRHAQGAGGEQFTSASSWARSLYHAAAARLNLNITIDSLQRGQHIECKDLEEVTGAEDALMDACKNLKGYLQTATTFDGREVVFDFSKDEPEAISKPVLIAAASSPAPIAQPMPSADRTVNMIAASPPTAAAATYAYDYTAPPANPLQPLFNWWNGLTSTQRKWIVIVGGIVIVFIFFKTL